METLGKTDVWISQVRCVKQAISEMDHRINKYPWVVSPLILQTKNIKVQTIEIDTNLGNTKNYGQKPIKNPDSLFDKTSIVQCTLP